MPVSSAIRSASALAAIRRGWVCPIMPRTPRPICRQILGSWVDFPGAGLARDDDHLVRRRSRPARSSTRSGDRQFRGEGVVGTAASRRAILAAPPSGPAGRCRPAPGPACRHRDAPDAAQSPAEASLVDRGDVGQPIRPFGVRGPVHLIPPSFRGISSSIPPKGAPGQSVDGFRSQASLMSPQNRSPTAGIGTRGAGSGRRAGRRRQVGHSAQRHRFIAQAAQRPGQLPVGLRWDQQAVDEDTHRPR